jgi:hypothetical protein
LKLARTTCAGLLLASACGLGDVAKPSAAAAGIETPPDFASGQRLRARKRVIGGSVVLFVGFHDIVLDVDCTFGDDVGPGPMSWCLPDGSARVQDGQGPYLDNACTVPAALTPLRGSAAYAILSPRDACSAKPRVFHAMPSRSERVFGLDDEGRCIRSSTTIPVQRLGDELPIDSFVSATEEAHGDGRITSRVLVASDGAMLVTGGFDVPRGAPADIVRARWVPSRQAFVGIGSDRFADDACTTTLATKIGHDARCPLSAVFVFADVCGNGTYHVLGASTASHRRDSKGACVAAGDDGTLSFAIGDEIPIESFAAVTTTDVGHGVVKRRGYGAGAAPVAWGEVVDAKTNEPCVVTKDPDGTLRCLPAVGELVAYYTDSSCTQPGFAHVLTGCAATDDVPMPRFVRDSSTGRAFEVGARADRLFESKNGACTPFTPVVTSTLFGANEVSVESYATAVELTD